MLEKRSTNKSIYWRYQRTMYTTFKPWFVVHPALVLRIGEFPSKLLPLWADWRLISMNWPRPRSEDIPNGILIITRAWCSWTVTTEILKPSFNIYRESLVIMPPWVRRRHSLLLLHNHHRSRDLSSSSLGEARLLRSWFLPSQTFISLPT